MSIGEVFPYPTVKKVIFQVRFPNLFFIENKIGEIQLKIMNQFPDSKLIFRRNIIVADVGPDVKEVDVGEDQQQILSKKIWQFNSKEDYRLNVLSDSLDITSNYHKTYNLGDGDKFRDIISFVLENFLQVTGIPIFTRVGIRYIDECPLPMKNNEVFKQYYNSVFPLKRFSIDEANEMNFKVLTQVEGYNLRYIESLQKIEEEYKLILDFDGFAENVKSEECLSITDKLHELISDEYEKTIKEPVKVFMRTGSIENDR